MVVKFLIRLMIIIQAKVRACPPRGLSAAVISQNPRAISDSQKGRIPSSTKSRGVEGESQRIYPGGINPKSDSQSS